LMGGEISVSSEPGKGSEFCFTARFRLPLDMGVQGCKWPQGLRVWILEGHRASRESLAAIFTAHKAEVFTGESCDDGLTALAQLDSAVDVLFIDARLPGQDVFHLVRDVQAAGKARKIVFMMRSGRGTGFRQRAIRVGVTACLTKPLSQADALQAVTRLAGDPAPARPKPVSKRLRILVAEDNSVNQLLAIGILERRGHAVTIAVNGEEALRMLR